MKSIRLWLAGVVVLASVGCSTVPTEVVDSIEVLRDNTASLAERYKALISRSAPAEGQTPEEWGQYVLHETTLIDTNKTLADRTLVWAQANDNDDTNDPPVQ